MAKKIFLDRQRVSPTTELPPVITGRTESESGRSVKSTPVSGIADELPFLFWTRLQNNFQNLMRPGVVC
jgi:hypothetical protein